MMKKILFLLLILIAGKCYSQKISALPRLYAPYNPDVYTVVQYGTCATCNYKVSLYDLLLWMRDSIGGGGGPASITNKHVGFGSPTNTLISSHAFEYDSTLKKLTILNAGGDSIFISSGVDGTTFINTEKTFITSQTITIRGVPYAFPTSQSIPSLLHNDGLGDLDWLDITKFRDTALPSANVWIGSSTGKAVERAVAGDLSLTNTGTWTVVNNAISNAKFRQGVARSVVGVTGNATGNVADIQGTANQTLVVNSSGTALNFGALNIASSAAVTGNLSVNNLFSGTGASAGTWLSGTGWSTPTGIGLYHISLATARAYMTVGGLSHTGVVYVIDDPPGGTMITAFTVQSTEDELNDAILSSTGYGVFSGIIPATSTALMTIDSGFTYFTYIKENNINSEISIKQASSHKNAVSKYLSENYKTYNARIDDCNINNGANSDSILNTRIINSTIDFAGFTGCKLTNCDITNSTITFTGNNQTLTGNIYMSDTVIGRPTGANQTVQFNDNNVFGGAAKLTYQKSSGNTCLNSKYLLFNTLSDSANSIHYTGASVDINVSSTFLIREGANPGTIVGRFDNHAVTLGDTVQFEIDKVNKYIKGGNGPYDFLLDFTNMQYFLGDYTGAHHTTYVMADDSSRNVKLVASNGVIVNNFIGSGTQMVVSDNTGTLSEQAIPTGVTTNTICSSQLFNSGSGVTDGGNVIIADGTTPFINCNLDNSGSFATITINLPVNPLDQQVVRIATTNFSVATLTLNGSGHTVQAGIAVTYASIIRGETFGLFYDQGTNTYYLQ
jgi:hypothetical protein